jgi:hypothetical protein
MNVSRGFAATLLTALFAVPAAAAAPQMPAEFLGEWNTPLSACGTGNSDAKLTISATSLAFSESRAAVVNVIRRAPRSLDVTARYSGEGSHWQSVDRFTLSANGNDLTVGQGSDVIVRHRCRAAPARR